MSVAALIGAAGTLSALALKNRMDRKRYERELQDQQKAWQRNNQYNSPAAQMARLKAAGLSPNLIYQNGGASVTSDTQGVPSFADSPMADFTPAAQLLQQGPQVQAQTDLLLEQASGNRYDNLFKLAHSKHIDAETKNWLIGLELNNQETAARIQNLSAQTGYTQAETANAMRNWHKINAEIDVLHSQKKLNDKEFEHLNAVINNVNANTDFVTQQYQKAIIETALLEMQELAERNAPYNSFQLAIENASEQVENLKFLNSEYMRRKQLVPSMNVPEQMSIYREYRGKEGVDDFLESTGDKGIKAVYSLPKSLARRFKKELRERLRHGRKLSPKERELLKELESL